MRGSAQAPAVSVIASVALTERMAVHNLTVAGAHVYFANGVLTHNCDVFSLLGRMLNALSKGEVEAAPEPPLVVGPNTYTIDQLIKMQPKGSNRI